jgi:uncharacterized protein (DUF488 family)
VKTFHITMPHYAIYGNIKLKRSKCPECGDVALNFNISGREQMAQTELFTIGYEGKEIDEFIARLKKYKVTRLIDVREIPLSRKKGFSKTILQDRLTNENIEYLHFKSLGSPSEIRHELKSTWDYDAFFRKYSEYLSNNLAVIKEVYQYILDGTNCIMCFEQFPNKCHRSVIAKKIKDYNGNGLKIIDI